jgi:hypothetical protein
VTSSPISPCPSCPPHAAGGHGCAVYPSSVTDAEWATLEPLLPAPGSTAGRGGRPEKQCRRLIVDAILYIVRGGIAWRQLPMEFPPAGTVYAVFARWSSGRSLRHPSPPVVRCGALTRWPIPLVAGVRRASLRPASPGARVPPDRTTRRRHAPAPRRSVTRPRRPVRRRRSRRLDTAEERPHDAIPHLRAVGLTGRRRMKHSRHRKAPTRQIHQLRAQFREYRNVRTLRTRSRRHCSRSRSRR